MKQTWRWFGPADEISIAEVRQTGAQGIVSALHHILPGEVWPVEEIKKRQIEIATPTTGPSGLAWDVVESVPVSEAIKTKTGRVAEHYEAYRQSLRNLAACGLRTVCYNFMPVIDWTRTDLAAVQPNGATAMHFDLLDFCVFDAFLLKRPAAKDDYPTDFLGEAEARFATLSDNGKNALVNNIVAGLPGANDNWTLDDVRDHLGTYAAINADTFRANLIDFLAEIVPTAQELGILLCCHPDDPPFPLLGLPRVMSSTTDYAHVLNAVDSPNNGATLCTGSLGVAEGFDPVDFVNQLGSRIHFVHLRNTRRLAPVAGERSSFYECEHLDGDTNMVATIRALMAEERSRKAEGRPDWEIPMRPDHGQAQLADLDRPLQPGYPLIGRMRGLAELRGIMAAVETVPAQ